MLVGTVGGGLLGQVSLSFPYVVRAVLLMAVFVVAFVVMHDLGFDPRGPPPATSPARSRALRGRASSSAGGSPIRLLMLASAVQGGFLAWAFYAAQPYLLGLLDWDAAWVAGLVAAGIALSTIAGNQVVSSRRGLRRRTTLLLGAGRSKPAPLRSWGSRSRSGSPRGAAAPDRGDGGHGPRTLGLSPSGHLLRQRATVISFDSMVSSTRRRRRPSRARRARAGASVAMASSWAARQRSRPCRCSGGSGGSEVPGTHRGSGRAPRPVRRERDTDVASVEAGAAGHPELAGSASRA